MKTYRNLYPQIADWRNLIRAWRKARRGKRYTPAAASFERNLDWELVSLQRDLEAETYQFEWSGGANPCVRPRADT